MATRTEAMLGFGGVVATAVLTYFGVQLSSATDERIAEVPIVQGIERRLVTLEHTQTSLQNQASQLKAEFINLEQLAQTAATDGVIEADVAKISANAVKLQRDIDALSLAIKSAKSQPGPSPAEVAEVLAANHADKLRGPRGDQGERGLQGMIGERGPIGLTGLQGASGAAGQTVNAEIDMDAILAAVLGSDKLRAA